MQHETTVKLFKMIHYNHIKIMKIFANGGLQNSSDTVTDYNFNILP